MTQISASIAKETVNIVIVLVSSVKSCANTCKQTALVRKESKTGNCFPWLYQEYFRDKCVILRHQKQKIIAPVIISLFYVYLSDPGFLSVFHNVF